MHGAHPARLAFKLRDLSLFLPLSFLLLLLRSYVLASRPFPLSLSLSKRRRATSLSSSFPPTSPNLLLLFPFYFSPRSGGAIRTRTCFLALARGALWEKPILWLGHGPNCLHELTEIPPNFRPPRKGISSY